MAPRALFALSLLLYAASIPLPAMGGFSHEPDYRGYHCLGLLPMVLMYPCWYANLLFYLGCYQFMKRRPGKARVAAMYASLLALTFIPMGISDGLRVGCFVWIGSISVLYAAATVGERRLTKEPH